MRKNGLMPRTDKTEQDDYLELIRRFPLKKIGGEADHSAALRVSGRLIGLERRLAAGESQYLDALVILIQEYERKRSAGPFPALDGISLLRHLMAERGMTQTALAGLLGVRESLVSMIL